MISVKHTPDFERIQALPRRMLVRSDAEALAAQLTPKYALVPGVSLRPWQAVALHEAAQCGGAWLALPVGQGKTLISFLLPTALTSERAMLVTPASLVQKTFADFASLRAQWTPPAYPVRVETPTRLAIEASQNELEAYCPDLIIIDEADKLANPRSSCARRIDRFILAHPSVRVIAMTGTPARKSILNYWHLLAWCLGDAAPIPLKHEEAETWSLAIDRTEAHPGPLGRNAKEAKAWYRDRLISSPGVVVVDEDSCTAPLTVRVRYARECTVLDSAFETLLAEMENPGGIPISDPLSRWRLDSQLGLGLYSTWDPPPPDAWRDARRNVARFVRTKIEDSTRSARPLDTEAQVLNRFKNHPVVTTWREIKPTFVGTTKTYWISRATLDSVHEWLRELSSPGVVWCGSVEFGKALAKEAALDYYGAKGDSKCSLHAADPTKSLVASWQANMQGFNLQAWTRQLLVMPPQSAKWLEQIFGRSHRAGQLRHVVVDVMASSGGTLDSLDAAFLEASQVKETVTLTQKILRADIERPPMPARTTTNEFRWARRSQ